MHEILDDVLRWRAAGTPVAVATVARVQGSGLQPLGAKFACTDGTELSGSVSGGCIEGAVYEEAQQVLAGGAPRLLHFGVADELAWSVGLACGGEVEVWVEALDGEAFAALAAEVAAGERLARATVVGGDASVAGLAPVGRSLVLHHDGRLDGGLGAPELTDAVAAVTAEQLARGEPARLAVGTDAGSLDVLVEVHAPPARLIVVGAVHIAVPLVTMARAAGYRTVVVDARSAFATRERFPHSDDLVLGWPPTVLAELAPDASTDVVVLTHDDKVDVPALAVAVRSRARYVGILGSRGHHAQRVRALRAMGIDDADLARVHAPIGLDLGAVGPEEIAVSVLAELIAARHPAARATSRA